MNDLSFGLRILLKQPTFLIAAVVTLALGTGAATAIFSIVNGVFLRPMAIPQADRLVVLTAGVSGDLSAPTFIEWRDKNRVFRDLAAVHPEDMSLSGVDEPERIRAWVVSPNFFDVLEVDAARGRTFSPERIPDEWPVVLSHGFWQRRFGADPSVVGQTLKLDGEIHTVVGVMAPELRFSGSRFGAPAADLWVQAHRGVPAPPIDVGDDFTTVRDIQYLLVIGRLEDGVSLEQADAEMDILAAGLAEQYPDSGEPREVSLAPLREQLVGEIRPALMVLLGAVGLVLLIACANVANLLLARAAGREQEIAIRAAQGASRWQLIRQLLSESLLLAVLGGVAGLVLALWGMDVIVSVSPLDVTRLGEIDMDGRVLGFAFVVTVLTGVLCGLPPALSASRPDVYGALREGGRLSGGAKSRRLRALLVAFEIGLALVVMIGAGLMLRSYLLLQEVDPGFNPENVLSLRLWIPEASYEGDPEIVSFYREVVAGVENLPGVISAAATLYAPLDGGRAWMRFVIEGRPESQADELPTAGFRVVTPGYFRSVGIPIQKGRDITVRDDADAPAVAVVNEAMARRFWPGESALGKQISGDGEEWIEIVGVVGDVRHEGLAVEPMPELYLPHQQMPIRFMVLVVRTVSDPLRLTAAVRTQIHTVDGELPVYRVATLEQIIEQSMSRPRFNALVIGAFAAVALALAVVGIYGLTAYTVRQRAQEMSIRMALGARRRDVIGLILKQVLLLTAVGEAAGLVVAVALSRALSGLLYGVSPTDPMTFVGVSVLLALVALAAAVPPRRRQEKLS